MKEVLDLNEIRTCFPMGFEGYICTKCRFGVGVTEIDKTHSTMCTHKENFGESIPKGKFM
jgi:hypothetical protein